MHSYLVMVEAEYLVCVNFVHAINEIFDVCRVVCAFAVRLLDKCQKISPEDSDQMLYVWILWYDMGTG